MSQGYEPSAAKSTWKGKKVGSSKYQYSRGRTRGSVASYLFLVPFHSFVPQISVDVDDVGRGTLSQDRSRLTLRVLNILFDERDA